MDMDTPDNATPVVPPAALVPAAPPPAPRRPASGIAAIVLAFIAAGVAAAALWQVGSLDRSNDAAAAETAQVKTDLDTLRRGADLDKRDRDALRQRLVDAENVNKSLREELFGVTERARVLEDAIANLAEKRLSGHDALLLDEAELVLLLAKERFELFNDSAAAERAYRIADATLAAVEDPAFATVRETLGVELRELAEMKQRAPGSGLADIEQLRTQLPALESTQATGQAASSSRLSRVLGQFVRISHTGESAIGARDPVLLRGLIGLDLRAAELALLERDGAAAHAALARAKTQIEAAFDRDAPNVQRALATLDRLGAVEPPPAPAQLGATLKELRNLRSTHNLGSSATAGGAVP